MDDDRQAAGHQRPVCSLLCGPSHWRVWGGGSDASSDTRKTIPQASPAQLAAAGLEELPFAPTWPAGSTRRADVLESHQITNPLFPISELHSAVLAGGGRRPSGPRSRSCPRPRSSSGNGQPVETLVSQYVAYGDGRIHEVALDWYAQADDGSVWYFGEDVFNYEDGVDRRHEAPGSPAGRVRRR